MLLSIDLLFSFFLFGGGDRGGDVVITSIIYSA